jgi:hypothetical protein
VARFALGRASETLNTGVNPGRAADRQPNPQQETLCDGLPHFGSSSSSRVDYRSDYDRKGRASYGIC